MNAFYLNKYKLLHVLLVLCILSQNLFFHIINPSSTMTMLLLADIFLLWAVALSMGYCKECRFINKYIIAIMVCILIPQTIYGSFLGQTVNEYIDAVKGLTYIFLAIPVLKLFLRENGIDKVLNMITFFTVISLGILFINSFALNKLGTSLLPFDYFQMPSTGRNDRLRLFLISDFLSFVAIYAFSNLFHKNSKKKLFYITAFAVTVGAEMYIEQTRMILMSIMVSCVIIFTLWVQKKQYKVLLYILAVALIGYGLIDNWFVGLFSSFSVSDSSTGVSTIYRTIELRYAGQMILENPILGTGMVSDYLIPVTMSGNYVMFDHTDIGLIGSITYIGFIGTAVLFIVPYIRFFKCVLRMPASKRKTRDYYFISGLLTFITVTSLTILITDNARIFVWPFILAVFEYCRSKYYSNRDSDSSIG